MSDSYRAIYDAAYARIGSVHAESAFQEATISMSNAFELHARCAMDAIAYEHTRPSVVYKPSLGLDGTKWCALYGEDLMSGVAGFGDTPAEAMADFDRAWRETLTPTAARLATAAAKETA